MNNRNKLGFSAFEVLVVLTLYASIFVIVFCMVFKSTKKMKLKSMKYDAIAFNYNVETYLTSNGVKNSEKVYLKDIVAFDESYNITSPFDANNMCSLNNSYIENKNGIKYVTLECDHYIISEYDVKGNGTPTIYWISSPMTSKPTKKKGIYIDEITVYNYKKNGHYVFSNFLVEEAFIKKYNEKENKNFTSIQDITSYEFRKEYRIRKAVNMD